MIYFTAHTFICVCHCIRVMFRVLGMYNFGGWSEKCYIYYSKSANRVLARGWSKYANKGQ